MEHYSIVVSKLDAFIRKYYFNLVLRGSLIFLASILIFIFILFIGEIYFYFPAVVKMTVGIILFLVGGTALVIWVIKPLFSLYKLGPRLQYEDASIIVGKHFPEIKDKLVNILQLQKSSNDITSLELLQASIDQKSKQVSVIPFQQAVNIAKNKKYIPYVAIPIVLFLLGWILLPQYFSNAGNRLLQPSTTFLKPAPFQFFLKNKQLEVPMFGNIELELLLQGDKMPAQVFCKIGNERIEMETDAVANFKLLLSRLTENTTVVFEGGGFESLPFEIKVIEQPIIEAVQIQLNYPDYIGKKNETLTSLSDWNLPEGTVVNWKLQAKHVQSVQFVLNDTNIHQVQNESKNWLYQHRFVDNANYQFQFLNKQNKVANQLQYQVGVIKDQRPSLQIKNIADKTFGTQILFVGNASDDYGLSKIQFVYQIEAGNKIIKRIIEPLSITSKQVSNIEHYFDAGVVALQPGQVLKYYFEAWDNDAVNGSKSSRSDIYSYALPVDKALDEAFEKNNQAISKGINQSEAQNKKIQQDMQSLQKDLLQSKTMTWQQQQQIEQLAKQQEQLQQKMEEVRKRFEEQQKQADQKNLSQDIKEKQEALKKQLDNIVDKEMQQQLDRLKDLLKQKNPDQAFQTLKQVEQDNKLSAMNMERIEELIAKLEVQIELENTARKIEDLVKQENALQDKTNQGNETSDDLKKEQEAIQKDFDKLTKGDLNDVMKKNERMQMPTDGFDDLKDLAKEANESMQQSSQSLDKQDAKGAQKAQQQASQQMQKMAQKMEQMAGGMDMEQLDIDIKATRQILSNLLRYSFDQERLMNNMKQTTVSGSYFVQLNKEQGQLRNNAKMIKDSLFVLSKRVFQIAAPINKETSDLEFNLQRATEAMEERNTQEILIKQQSAMTNANNLALLLQELLENLISEQSSAMQSGQSGKEGEQGQSGQQGKPGSKGQQGSSGANGSKGQGQGGNQMKDIITKQQQLGQGMQKGAGKNGQQGGKQGGGQQGSNGGGSGSGEGGENGEYGNSEQLAKLAREQATLRRQMQELSSYLNSNGMSGVSKEIKAIQELMDKNETDLVNKRLSGELIKRQQEILQRMLQTETAIREQEEDDKREGVTAEQKPRPIPPELKEYMQKNQSLLEQYKMVAPTLNPYYKGLSEQYLQKVN